MDLSGILFLIIGLVIGLVLGKFLKKDNSVLEKKNDDAEKLTEELGSLKGRLNAAIENYQEQKQSIEKLSNQKTNYFLKMLN